MMRFAIALFALVFVSQAVASDVAPPNIVVILCDDLGYGDVKCMNPDGKIPTPHMDRFASQGMIFTDAHSPSAVCSPTRYGLVTGRYAWRSRLKRGVLGGLSPRLIEANRQSFAQLLKNRGYHTACIGKWHLGMDWELKPGKQITELGIEPRAQVFNVEYDRPIKNGPNSVGFEHYFGISASLDMVPYTFIQNDRVAANPTEDRDFPLMLGRARGRCRKGPAAPGFDAADVLPTLTQKATTYLAAQSKQPAPFFLYLPFASPHTPILPLNEWQEKSHLNPYADFVMATDAAIGEVLAALDKHGLAQNTLVIITSDNGCSPQADFPLLLKHGHNPSSIFRGHKADIYEGGHRVPFLVRWPGYITAGTKSDRLVCLTDIAATCMDIAGLQPLQNACEDSFSFRSAWHPQNPWTKRESLVMHSINGSFAIREGKWKLCLCPDSGGWSFPRPGQDRANKLPAVQLFDLSTDIGEKINLQAQHPDVVKQLTQKLELIAKQGRSTPGKPQPNTGEVDIANTNQSPKNPLKKNK